MIFHRTNDGSSMRNIEVACHMRRVRVWVVSTRDPEVKIDPGATSFSFPAIAYAPEFGPVPETPDQRLTSAGR
jgi:hypothetical protein